MFTIPRIARKRSENGLFHIIQRGINRQTIFEEEEDKCRLLKILCYYMQISNFKLYGFCFMDNHVHLLIKEETEPISKIVKRISSSYVLWYNRKYGRCGHLFQERFKSEAILSERQFLITLRYIHNNPVKAGLVDRVREYRWSSYNEYMNKSIIADTSFAFKILSDNHERAKQLFEKYTNEQSNDECMECWHKYHRTDNEIKMHLEKLGLSDLNKIQQMHKTDRYNTLQKLKQIDGVTIRQLSRLTGISKSVIARI